MNEIQRHGQTARASAIVVSGQRIETAGIVAGVDTARDITAQTQDVLAQLEALLQQVGARREDITRVQIWLADMADFDAMNRVYDTWVDNSHQPARACVGAPLADSHYRIEIQATGWLPDSARLN